MKFDTAIGLDWPAQTRVAMTFSDRLRGFLGKAVIGQDEAILFKQCSCIHTLGMRTAIDVVFLDQQMTILRLAPNVKPNRIVWCAPSFSVLELSPGQIEWRSLFVGHRFVVHRIF